MRILNENGIEITENDVDYLVGYLIEEKIFVSHHDAVEACPEQGHYEVVAEYPNGGKDVEWLVDVPAVEAKEAYDEYETILRYILFSEKELDEKEILSLKQKLAETDYCVIKIAEGSATLEEYSDVISERKKWRQMINNLENKTY